MTEPGKRAIHVKWAGKTIALGTFPNAIADEKSARAKALTRAWRSTMRPKPDREWVMAELERLGVRVVSGSRSGRTNSERKGEDTEERGAAAKTESGTPAQAAKNSAGWSTGTPNETDFDSMMQQRRNSSIGFSMLEQDLKRRSSSLGLGTSVGMDDVVMPPHRPLVGGASAAAYEAARADHYSSLAAKKRLSGDAPRRSSMGTGGMMSPGGLGAGGLSATSNQHYEMLKLHHMNLLNEIQETTLMMNLYQQQQLQQQRQELQEQESRLQAQGNYGGGSMGGMGAMGGMRKNSLALSDIGRSPSLGLGGSGSTLGMSGFGSGSALGFGDSGSIGRSPSLGLGGAVPGAGQRDSFTKQQGAEPDKKMEQELSAQELEQRDLEERLAKVKAEIAQRQREAEALEASFGKTEKRKSGGSAEEEDEQEESAKKKRKSDDSSGVNSAEV